MKADPAVQRRLLDLAEVDGELNRLAHRRRTLPEHAQLAEAERAVRTAKDKLVAVETAAGDLDRDIRRLERDIDGVRARAQRDNALLAGSGVGARQATELQHELETLARVRGARVHYLFGSRRGRPGLEPPSPPLDASTLAHLVPDIADQDVYLCGPTGFMRKVEAVLHELGVPRRHVHAERFAY